MNTTSTDGKKELRRRITALRASIPESVRECMDERIYRRITELECYRAAGTIFVYVSSGWEIDTRELIRRAFADGKNVTVPLCAGAGVMDARYIRSEDELVPGFCGIPEPSWDSRKADPGDIELAVVPALAYDRRGVRLGRGGGYYDRFLPELECPKAGLIYERFIYSALPREVHDISADMAVTEEGVYIWK